MIAFLRTFLIPGIFMLISAHLEAQKPVLILPVGHSNAVTCLDYSDDGAYLVSGSQDRTLKLWNRQGQLIRTFPWHDSPLMDVLISPDQRYVLARTDSSYYLWSIEGTLLHKTSAVFAPSGPTVAAYDRPVFSKDGELLLFAHQQGTATIYDLSGEQHLTIPCDEPANLKLAPGQQLIMTSVGDYLQIYDRRGQLKNQFEVPNEAKALFPDFAADFLSDEQIVIGQSYASEQGIGPGFDYSEGGLISIFDLQGKLLASYGSPVVIRKREDGTHYRVLAADGNGSGEEVSADIALTTLAWSTGGAINTTDRMNWNDLKLSADRKKLILSNSYFLQLWELPTGSAKMIRQVQYASQEAGQTLFYPLVCSPDGKHLAVKAGNELILHHLEGGGKSNIVVPQGFEGNFPFGGWPSPVSFSPDNKQIAIGDQSGNISIRNLQGEIIQSYGSQRVQQVIAVGSPKKNSAEIEFYLSEDARTVAASRARNAGESTIVRLTFDLAKGLFLDRQTVSEEQLPRKRENAFVNDQFRIVSSFDMGFEDFYNGAYLNTMAGIVQVSRPGSDEAVLNFSASGSISDLGLLQNRYLLTSDFIEAPVLWDFEKLQRLADKAEPKDVYGSQLTMIPEALVPSARVKQLTQLPIRTKYLDFALEHPQVLLKNRDSWDLINKNGVDQYVESQFTDFQLLDVESGRQSNFAGHSLKLLGAKFLLNDRFVISWSEDRSCRIWDPATETELLKLFWLNERDWIVVSPDGLFDASPGVMNRLYYVVGKDEIIELDQLKTRYYEPGLLQKVLAYNEERIRPVAAFDQIALYPKVEVAPIKDDVLRIRLIERNGGIGKLSIFINGKEVAEEANPLPRGEQAKRPNQVTFDLKPFGNYLFRHPDSTNMITIHAYNEEGWLKSPAINLEYRANEVRSRGFAQSSASWAGKFDPKLYVISIGTADYSGTQLDLQYADRDAAAMARAFQSVGTALFTNGDSLEVHCFSTTTPPNETFAGTPIRWHFADKENINAVFEDIRERAKAEDVIVVYLSGHGVTYGSAERALFHYLTQGIASEDLSDAAVRKAYTISSEELTQWINNIPALKQVLIIDACNSGKIIENLTGGTKALNSSQIRALDRMKDRTGMFVLSGSASDKVSYEAGEYGQGLLTYALLEGMRGIAARKDVEGKEIIDVMRLFQHARDRVPQLAATINGIQTPMLGFPSQGASFDIGILDESAKANIPIGNRKPVVIKSAFMNKQTFLDELKLAELLESALREEGEEGSNADLIYVDVYDYPGAYTIRGMYEMTAAGISMQVKLFRDLKDPIELEIRPSDDPDRLVRYIVREVKKVLKVEEN